MRGRISLSNKLIVVRWFKNVRGEVNHLTLKINFFMKKIYIGKFTLLEDENEGGVCLLTSPN